MALGYMVIHSNVVVLIRSPYFIPHFKHARGEASEDCEFYSKYYIENYNAYESLGLELRIITDLDEWGLSLFLPEFNKTVFDVTNVNDFCHISFIVDRNISVSASNLWPGKKGYLCKVEPHSYDYEVVCKNVVIGIDYTRWTKGSKGLSPSGVFFRHPFNGGKRLPKGETIIPDSIVYLVAKEQGIAISEESWPKGLDMRKLVVKKGWCVWEVNIPSIVSPNIQAWLGQFGYSISKMGYKMEAIWPTPFLIYNDNSIGVNSNNIIIKATSLRENGHGVLFHTHDSKIDSNCLPSNSHQAVHVPFYNLKRGLHKFNIDKFSDYMDIVVEPIHEEKLRVEYEDINIKIGSDHYIFNPLHFEEEQEPTYTFNKKCGPLGLSINGYKGLGVKVSFIKEKMAEKQLNLRLPVIIDNIFDLGGNIMDSISFDFKGFGSFKVRMQVIKDELLIAPSVEHINSLLDRILMMSVKGQNNDKRVDFSKQIDHIFMLLNKNKYISKDFSQFILKFIHLKRLQKLPYSVKPYLINIMMDLTKQLRRVSNG